MECFIGITIAFFDFDLITLRWVVRYTTLKNNFK